MFFLFTIIIFINGCSTKPVSTNPCACARVYYNSAPVRFLDLNNKPVSVPKENIYIYTHLGYRPDRFFSFRYTYIAAAELPGKKCSALVRCLFFKRPRVYNNIFNTHRTELFYNYFSFFDG